MGCARRKQEEVIVRCRVLISSYLVNLGSETYLERKLPFAGSGLPGDNGVDVFYNDIKALHSLGDCTGMAKIAGILLDSTGKYVQSYLQERPALGTVGRLIDVAEERGEHIPWVARQTWAKQMITAVSEVHTRGIVIRTLGLRAFGIRSDGSVVLTAVRESGRRLVSKKGRLAPELRKEPNDAPLLQSMTFRSDIFQLGMALWMLAEQRNAVGGYCFCPRHVCTSVTRYLCTAEHNNPIQLPLCSSIEVLGFYNDIIRHCRKYHPTERKPVRDLLQYFEETSQPLQMAALLKRYDLTSRKHVYCSLRRMRRAGDIRALPL